MYHRTCELDENSDQQSDQTSLGYFCIDIESVNSEDPDGGNTLADLSLSHISHSTFWHIFSFAVPIDIEHLLSQFIFGLWSPSNVMKNT